MGSRIWFNKTFSSLHAVLRQAKSACPGNPWHVTVSHTQPGVAIFATADAWALEPAHLRGPDYVAWCLEFCREHRIDLFFPGKSADELADARSEFAALGTKLSVAATGDTLRLLEQKAAFLTLVPPTTALVPRFLVVTTLEQFRAAVTDLQAQGHSACCKPSVAVNGLGFYRLEDELPAVERWLNSIPYRISLTEAEQILASQETFPEVLVMEYLEGVEYSVDCLAKAGRLLASVIRCKPLRAGAPQEIMEHPELARSVELLTAQFHLDGLFNVQFRETAGVPKLLEINGRPSGGMMFSCAAGMPLLEMAVAAALDPEGPDPTPPVLALPQFVSARVEPVLVANPAQRQYRLPGGCFEITLDHEVEPLDELCQFALRNNPRRRFLFVSRVLGRHLPTRPAAIRRVALRLATQLQEGMPPGPCIFFGMAETATTLGQAVFRAWLELGGQGLYVDGTRRRTGGAVAFSFSEDHSHATAHVIHEPTVHTDPDNIFRTAHNLVVVDDEATTGQTAANLITQFAQWRGEPLAEFHRSLAVLLRWQPVAQPAPTFDQVVSLAGGKFTFTPTAELPAASANPAGAETPRRAPTSSRHGLRAPQVAPWTAGVSTERVLVIGNGEFGFAPLAYAEALEAQGATAWVQATTRSPILMGGAIGHIRAFPALSGESHAEFLYNVPDDHAYDRVILCLEDDPPSADHPIYTLPKLEIRTIHES